MRVGASRMQKTAGRGRKQLQLLPHKPHAALNFSRFCESMA
jgi:hypothetical protein